LRTSLLLLLVITLAGCRGGSGAIDAVPVIRTQAEYDNYVIEAQKLSQEPMKKFDAGEPLSEVEKKDLQQALFLFEGMAAFDPTGPNSYLPFFASGKINHTLGNYQRSLENFQQCISVAPTRGKPTKLTPDISEDDRVLLMTIAEARYLASLCYFELRDFGDAAHQANLANQIVPNSANYRVAEARAELEIGNEMKAVQLIAEALYIDPNHKIAQQVAKLLNMQPAPPQKPSDAPKIEKPKK